MYSCIAGFVEPGETLEEAVRREVREEVGVELAEVRYVRQPALAVPPLAHARLRGPWASGDIEIDEREIVDAAWYRRRRPAHDPAPA